MGLKIKPVGKSLSHLVKQVSSLKDESVQAGHFDEQGLHQSGFTYAELMAFHANGGNPEGDKPVIPRPLLKMVYKRYSNLNDRGIKAAFTRWKKRQPSEESNAKLLNDIGRRIATLIKNGFGDPSLIAATPSNPDPLIDTGELKSKVAHRDTMNKAVRTI